MIPDYYSILGVDSKADFATIQSAFRQLAMRCHPDRGGSHEQMVRINEAWNILANPTSRAEYDQLRATHRESSAMKAAAAQARADANVYPETWDGFDHWLSGIGKDFADTRFGQSKLHAWFPAPNTVSGWIFIIIGGIIGGWVFNVAEASTKNQGPESSSNFRLMLMVIGLGCWAGALAHRVMTRLFFKAESPTPTGSAVSVSTAQASSSTSGGAGGTAKNTGSNTSTSRSDIPCPTCNQMLRVPDLEKKIKVTCSRCGEKFLHQSVRQTS